MKTEKINNIVQVIEGQVTSIKEIIGYSEAETLSKMEEQMIKQSFQLIQLAIHQINMPD